MTTLDQILNFCNSKWDIMLRSEAGLEIDSEKEETNRYSMKEK